MKIVSAGYYNPHTCGPPFRENLLAALATSLLRYRINLGLPTDTASVRHSRQDSHGVSLPLEACLVAVDHRFISGGEATATHHHTSIVKWWRPTPHITRACKNLDASLACSALG